MAATLSIVIPAYNESARLGRSLETIYKYLNQAYPDSEVIIVDDGSTDDTAKVAEASFKFAGKIRARLIGIKSNRGKGSAVRAGLLESTAPIVLFSDADLSTPISETPKLVAAIEQEGYDLVFGSRALDKSLIGVHQPWRREQGGRVFNQMVRLATGLDFMDTQCGFKAFRMATCRPVIEAAVIDRFAFDVELLYVAHLAGLRLSEIPVRWDHNDGSKVNVLRDSWRMFLEVQRIRARKGRYLETINSISASASQQQRGSRATSKLSSNRAS
ncbi:MAG TPA: dolichyl-phosphate beta-glucosyltransferase [Pyrinomonadaceae bacterium]|nr:dolichyl-phosphate beta-glucosyltransferase [Pyrinomonadaceae bacterium]